MSRVDGVQLSPQQRRLWRFHHAGNLPHACGVIRVHGGLDAERLRRALTAVVARHEILRTAFRRDTRLKFPLQTCLPAVSPAWRVVDLGSPADEPGAVDRLLDVAARAALDLERGAVLDATLVARGSEQHDLVIALSALCADAWTLRRLVRELGDAYAHAGAPRAGEPAPLQYAQFAEWQHELLGDAAPRSVVLSAVRLPFEAVAADGGSLRDIAERDLDPALAAELDAHARRDGLSLASVLLAAFQVVLARLGERRDLAVAVASAGRALEDVQAVLGPVATWRPVPAWLDDAMAFRELARQTDAAIEDADQADGEGFALTADDHDALAAHIGFELDEQPAPFSSGGLSWQLVAHRAPMMGPRLALTVQRRSGALRLLLRHDRQRLAAGGADALLEQVAAAVASAVAGWSAPIGRLGLVGPTERARLLAAGGATRARGASGEPLRCLHDAFHHHAERQPDALAVVCRDQQLTYRALSTHARTLAHRLHRLGVARGSPVALICERSVQLIVGLVGILDAGAAYVPLDPHAPAERLAQQIRIAGCAVVVVSGGVRVPAGERAVISLDDVVQQDPEPAASAPRAPSPSVPLDELASIVFTSGSTGVPKGVAITHRGIASYARAVCGALGIEQGLHFATVTTPSADLGNTSIFASLATGGCLHVIDHETAGDGRRFAEYARRWPIDVLKIVPSHLSALLDASDGAALLPRRLLVLGGEALPLALVERLSALSSRCAIANHYGPTETTVGALVLPLHTLGDRRGCASVPIGRPLANAEAYVLDPGLELAPVGVLGELYLGGEGLARGYVNQPAVTAERFVPDPFGDGRRLYRTGDHARVRPDGTIEFVGRRDHQLKIRGFRVELGEIEARLRDHPAIERAVVVARKDASSAALVAYVVVRGGALDEPGLRAFLKDRLPDYMVPGAFVPLAALPLTSNGKIDRHALPSPPDPRSRREHVAPRTPVESTIAALWAEALGLPRVSIEDNFFDLGGHSLLAIPLVHRLRQALGESLSPMAIFQAPTVAALARLVDPGADRAGSAVLLRPHGSSARRTSAADDTAPLFCVDPTGWHVAAYQPLSDALGDRLPVFGLELRLERARELAATGAAEGTAVHRLCEQLAHDIRRVQPRGPYRVLGWSLGGVLALGVARALEEQAEGVAFLGILDTQPRARLYAGGLPDLLDELAAYIDPARTAALFELPAAELAALRARLAILPEDQRAMSAAAWAQARGFLPSDAAPEALAERYRWLRDAAVFMSELRPRCLNVPIHVWWSTETLARHGGPPEDFARYTRGPLHASIVRGDHIAVVQDRDVHEQIHVILQA